MKKKRRSPYDIEDVMNRDKCSKEEAIKTINELKMKTSGSKKSYIKRYGKELGEQKYREFCSKSSHTKEKYQQKYGEIWEEKWNDYLKTKDSMSLDFHIKKYGEEIGTMKYNERINSVTHTLENMIEKYGEEIGTMKYNEMIEKRSYSCSKDGLINKFGIQIAEEICLSKSNKGHNNGMYGKVSPEGSGNGWSGWYKDIHFRSILELSYLLYLDENNIEYKSAETKEYEVQYRYNNSDRTYKPDFIVNDEIIEIKPKNLINSEINKLKFDSARKQYGTKFKILTEKDFPQIVDISPLVESGVVRLMERYQRKYNENNKNRG